MDATIKDNMDVIGRKEEKEILDRITTSKVPEFVVIYGRRRVGKTHLIREHLKSRIVFEFTGSYQAGLQTQLSNFYSEYLRRTGEQKGIESPPNWNRAFEYLSAYLNAKRKLKTKQVVFIDELPWIDTPRSQFISALEYFWNHVASKQANVALICCGSASSWIHRKLLKSRGGLHNRVTRRIRLRPFSLMETKQFLKSRHVRISHYQIIQIYMAMGGIPHYLKEVEPGMSTVQNIDKICFSRHGLLRDEFDGLYKSLFKNAEDHLAIIQALGNTPQGLSRAELLQISKLPEGGTFSRALEELVECDFVGHFLPFGRKKKNARYKLIDHYSHFYIKYISKTKEGKNIWATLSQKPTFKAWSGYALENIFMSHMDMVKKKLGISGIHSQESSWSKRADDELPGAQIDVVMDRADQVINLCEAKFSDVPFIVSGKVAQTLQTKKAIFRDSTGTKKTLFTTLFTTYPAIRNKYYLEEIQSEVTMDDLFSD